MISGNDLSNLDKFLVHSAKGDPEGCRVIVDYSQEPGTMRVPPDVFAKIKAFSDEVEFNTITRLSG